MPASRQNQAPLDWDNRLSSEPVSSKAMLEHLRSIEETVPETFSEGDARQLAALEKELGLNMGENIGENNASQEN